MIVEPTLIIDEVKAKSNIKKMVLKAQKNGCEFRPHFKTHQSYAIGDWFRNEGVQGITVSSLKMAEYFSKKGWESITVAFPVNTLDKERIQRLTENIDLRLLVNSGTALNELDRFLNHPVGIYIELDPGYGRTGIPFNDIEKIRTIKVSVDSNPKFRFEGFYTHTGHSYKCRSKKEILDLITPVLEKLEKINSEFNSGICFGDTPSCSVLESFGVINQVSPGNFVFYDWTQYTIGSCSINEIAIAMQCPVVAKFEIRNELLIHGGAVHFSKDFLFNDEEVPYYGVLAETKDDGWGNQIHGAVLKSVSQEHGIVSYPNELMDTINPGDIVTILPIHSCLTADTMAKYQTVNGQILDHMNKHIFD